MSKTYRDVFSDCMINSPYWVDRSLPNWNNLYTRHSKHICQMDEFDWFVQKHLTKHIEILQFCHNFSREKKFSRLAEKNSNQYGRKKFPLGEVFGSGTHVL